MKEIEFNPNNWDLVIHSPGRINLIGGHTDYNNGFVLPTAIDKKIQFKFKRNGSLNTCNIYSNNFDAKLTFELNTVSKSNQQWENYILGVIHEIQQFTNELSGFDCELDSDIPIGSGISSSAALECGLAFGLNELFNLSLSKLDIVKLSQRAEHNYVGTKCGIMDQFASVMSKKDHVILLDCESLDFRYVPIDIKPYKILLLNTNVSHNLATGEYNIRREQCEKGVEIIKEKYPQINSLRDVSQSMLNEFKDNIDKTVYKRCLYITEEQQRVLASVKALENSSLSQLGNCMYETHEGLSNLFEVSCKELDFLVDFSKPNNQILGARMMGGGFGGCTINIIHQDGIENFLNEVSDAYFKEFQIGLTAFEVMPSEGTSIKHKQLRNIIN